MSKPRTSDKNTLKATQHAIAENQHLEGALLPILHHIQQSLGYVPKESVPSISQALNLSRAEVHGVISYYHTFTHQPQGETVIQVCRAESCQAVGGRVIEATLKERLGIHYDETTQDGKFTLEAVYCLGNCACSPALRIGDEIYGRVTPKKVDHLINEHRNNSSNNNSAKSNEN